MTIPAGESALNVYDGNGAADTYDYEFKISDEADLLVKETDTNDVETTLALTTDYTVTGVGNNDGGTITLVAGNLTVDHKLTIEDNVEVSQGTPFGQQSSFLASIHETAFDKVTRLVRRAFSDSSLHMRLQKAYSDGVSVLLPKPVASMIPRWNATADALENVSAETINGEAAIASYSHQIFLDVTDYTAGVDTQLTLSSAPGSKNNCQIYFDNVYVSKDDYEVADDIITFDAAIPGGTAEVEVVYGQSAGDAGPDHTSIAPLATLPIAVDRADIDADFTYSLDFLSLTTIASNDLDFSDLFIVYDVSAGAFKKLSVSDAGGRVKNYSGTSRAIDNDYLNSDIVTSNASAVGLQINTGVGSIGDRFSVEQGGLGQVTIGGTATVRGRNGLKTAGQYAVIFVKCVATDVWTVGGDSVA